MRKIFLMLLALFFVLAVPVQSVYAAGFSERAASLAEVKAVRVSTSSEKVRLVVDAGAEVNYETMVLSNPQRIVVDLHGAWLNSSVNKEMVLDSRYVSKVRIAQFNEDTVRVVIESNVGRNSYDVFALEGGSVPYRVVMDFGNLGKSSSGVTIDFGKKPEEKPSSNPVILNPDKKDNEAKPDAVTTEKEPEKVIVEPVFTKGILGKTICIDAGHGGSDVGAIGPTGVTEKSVTLKVAEQLQNLLKTAGAKVIMTRNSDTEVSKKKSAASDIEELQARCDVANDADADIFISIHLDSFSSSTPSGTTGYYYGSGTKAGQRLSQKVAEGVIKSLGTSNRGNKACNFYVVKHTDMPATLCELAFISNNKEEKLISSPAGVKKAAEGIFEGIKSFFG